MGSAAIVASRDTGLQSVGVVIKYHAPTDACLISRWQQVRISSKKINKKASYILCRVLLAICKVLWLGSPNSVAVLEISH